MALTPNSQGPRSIGDYLFSIDPSGQADFGYAWGGYEQRPDSIYNLTGSGQLVSGGAFFDNKEIYVRTARMVSRRHPMWLAGPGYDIFGGGIGLQPASGHDVFTDNTPVIDFPEPDKSKWPVGPIDLRYDSFRSVFTAPYHAFPVGINSLAASGTAYDHNGNLISSGVPWNYYSQASGHYRYLCSPYTFQTDDVLQNHPSVPLLNTFEKNGDVNFLTVGTVVTAFVNPNVNASGSLVCTEHPVRFCAFI